MQYFNDKFGITNGIISGNVTSLFDVIKMDTETERNIEFYKDSVKFLKDSNGVFAACVETNILADFIPQFKGGDISTFAHYLGVIFRYQCGVAKYKRPLRTA